MTAMYSRSDDYFAAFLCRFMHFRLVPTAALTFASKNSASVPDRLEKYKASQWYNLNADVADSSEEESWLPLLDLNKLLMWLNINELLKNADAKTYEKTVVLASRKNGCDTVIC